MSLSARRAWIEILSIEPVAQDKGVALRKESVDRNNILAKWYKKKEQSLSARRAWIEIWKHSSYLHHDMSLSARRAWIEIHLSPNQ